nr:MAG TPA: hypothetical protein [Caudoviricetes sp.]
MNENNIVFKLKKSQLSFSLPKENTFVKKILDIDFFNSRKSRIAEDIKSKNELEKLNGISIDKFKQANSK